MPCTCNVVSTGVMPIRSLNFMISTLMHNAVISRQATNLSGKSDKLNPSRLDKFVRHFYIFL